MKRGWRDLLDGYPWFRGAGNYPLRAYSEFMPPPRVGRKPCGEIDRMIFSDDDPFGWHITAEEETHELRPGLAHIAAHLLTILMHLGGRDPAHAIARGKLENNPYWPAELQEHGAPAQERYVVIAPLALSRTQDDKGRVRWTLFGASERGPAVALPETFMHRLVEEVYGTTTGLRFGVPDSIRGVRCVVTFAPYTSLPSTLRDAYRAGDVHLIPFPGSMVFWGVKAYADLQQSLPRALQIPLLQSMHRREAPGGIRVPQSGWFHEKTAKAPDPHPQRGPYRQTFKRTHRWSKSGRDEDELDLIGKTDDPLVHVLFSTNPDDLGLYGKPMARNVQLWSAQNELLLDGARAGRDEIRVAAEHVRSGGTFGYRFQYPPMQVGPHEVFWHRPLVAYAGHDDRPHIIADAPAGVIEAADLELTPRIEASPVARPKTTANDASIEAITFLHTATRAFEIRYWDTMKALSMGEYVNKDNADCCVDPITQRHLKHHERDLDPLARMLLAHYRNLGAEAELLPFQWDTDFPFDWSQGWQRNQGPDGAECNVIVKIAGRNRKRAVLFADHYDTAYMEDVYGYPKGGGPRLAAHGSDDNDSATATLMLAAPIFLELSRKHRLECDVWLVHLTGEEFPADCLGARALTQRIVEGAVSVDVAGIVLMDMIGHNNDKARDVFQISPGEGSRALELARFASEAARLWNQLPQGARHGRGKRSKDGSVPGMAEFPRLRGEVRLHTDVHSTLYNTDGQIFSDAGLPVVLFMENYDINRQGYHDSHDTMENIDLDYGAALAAIAIETVARIAASKP